MPAASARVSRVRFCFAASLALTLAGCGGKEKEQKPQGPPEAGYVVLKSETVPLFTELAGRTAAFETSEVRPQVSGVIQARLFTEGALVRKGQTLYQIDPRLYRASAAQARANLASAEANRVAARARAERYRPLAEQQAIARQDLTDAVATAGQAAASVEQTRAALDTARINLAFTRVPAPITGRIGRSLFTVGALVSAGQTDPLATIQRLDPIFVDIQQSAADLLALRRALATAGVEPASAQVRLRLEDGSEYGLAGTVQFAEVTVDPTTGTVTLRARFPNPRGLLLPGMYVRARFAAATVQNAILVPQAAVDRDPRGNAAVLLVGPGNKALRREVKAERAVGDKWLVTAGVRPGDKVITEGLAKVKPGQPVRPVPAGSPARWPQQGQTQQGQTQQGQTQQGQTQQGTGNRPG